jgi:hypothetical protein
MDASGMISSISDSFLLVFRFLNPPEAEVSLRKSFSNAFPPFVAEGVGIPGGNDCLAEFFWPKKQYFDCRPGVRLFEKKIDIVDRIADEEFDFAEFGTAPPRIATNASVELKTAVGVVSSRPHPKVGKRKGFENRHTYGEIGEDEPPPERDFDRKHVSSFTKFDI